MFVSQIVALVLFLVVLSVESTGDATKAIKPAEYIPGCVIMSALALVMHIAGILGYMKDKVGNNTILWSKLLGVTLVTLCANLPMLFFFWATEDKQGGAAEHQIMGSHTSTWALANFVSFAVATMASVNVLVEART